MNSIKSWSKYFKSTSDSAHSLNHRVNHATYGPVLAQLPFVFLINFLRWTAFNGGSNPADSIRRIQSGGFNPADSIRRNQSGGFSDCRHPKRIKDVRYSRGDLTRCSVTARNELKKKVNDGFTTYLQVGTWSLKLCENPLVRQLATGERIQITWFNPNLFGTTPEFQVGSGGGTCVSKGRQRPTEANGCRGAGLERQKRPPVGHLTAAKSTLCEPTHKRRATSINSLESVHYANQRDESSVLLHLPPPFCKILWFNHLIWFVDFKYFTLIWIHYCNSISFCWFKINFHLATLPQLF